MHDLARDAGVPLIAMASSVDDAVRSARSGADVIVAQGAEAGGHRSSFDLPEDGEVPLIGTFALVPQVVRAVDVPVVAAGGVMDGRGLAAALALGAQGVQMGTRFLVAAESGAPEGYKRRLREAHDVGHGDHPGPLRPARARACPTASSRRSRPPGRPPSATRARPSRAPTCGRRPPRPTAPT